MIEERMRMSQLLATSKCSYLSLPFHAKASVSRWCHRYELYNSEVLGECSSDAMHVISGVASALCLPGLPERMLFLSLLVCGNHEGKSKKTSSEESWTGKHDGLRLKMFAVHISSGTPSFLEKKMLMYGIFSSPRMSSRLVSCRVNRKARSSRRPFNNNAISSMQQLTSKGPI